MGSCCLESMPCVVHVFPTEALLACSTSSPACLMTPRFRFLHQRAAQSHHDRWSKAAAARTRPVQRWEAALSVLACRRTNREHHPIDEGGMPLPMPYFLIAHICCASAKLALLHRFVAQRRGDTQSDGRRGTCHRLRWHHNGLRAAQWRGRSATCCLAPLIIFVKIAVSSF